MEEMLPDVLENGRFDSQVKSKTLAFSGTFRSVKFLIMETFLKQKMLKDALHLLNVE